MKIVTKIVLVFALICLGSSLVACEKPGPAEKAGKDMDNAIDSMKQKANELTK